MLLVIFVLRCKMVIIAYRFYMTFHIWLQLDFIVYFKNPDFIFKKGRDVVSGLD